MKLRIRQLLCLWLAIVIVLLPVSGSLLAASLVAGSDGDAGIGNSHAHHGAVPAPGARDNHGAHSGPAADIDDEVVLTTVLHDCDTALCAGTCSGCSACHAPPVTPPSSADSTDRRMDISSVTTSTPPPGVVFRPPIDTTA